MEARRPTPDLVSVTRWDDALEERLGIIGFESKAGEHLRVALSHAETWWLLRAEHPVYARHIAPVIAAMAERALAVEIRAAEAGVVSATLVYAATDGVISDPVPIATALLITSKASIPVFVEEALLMTDAVYTESVPATPDPFRVPTR